MRASLNVAVQSLFRRLDHTVRPPGGLDYSTWVEARPRTDGRWEGLLEYRPAIPGPSLRTSVQTTQASSAAVLDWAVGLTTEHLNNAFFNAYVAAMAPPRPLAEAVPVPGPTPPRPDDRLEHLRPVERHVMAAFTLHNSTRLSTRSLFGRAPHSNADLVRAFEELEKRWRFLIRHTDGGIDWIELTMEGARALELPAKAGEKTALEPPNAAH